MRCISKHPLRKTLSLVIQTAVATTATIMSTNLALAAPTGGAVVAGTGSISEGVNTIVTQTSPNLVVNWNSFNVQENEQVQFFQPSNQSAVLNNILDQSPSEILGDISANGRVFLSNPNGIIFGESSTVNVGALVATTHTIDADQFMQGNYELKDTLANGAIINRGMLKAATGGSITLLGDSVENSGVILAQLGHANLAVGSQATIDFDGDGLLKFSVSAEQLENINAVENAILNTGSITAGSVLLEARVARDVFSNVVNNSGVIKATGVDVSQGVIKILGDGDVLNSGDLIASSDSFRGGNVQLFGERISISAGQINTQGVLGAGNISLGGEFNDLKGSALNTKTLFISKDATIKANALESGDGGNIVLWSEGSTVFEGIYKLFSRRSFR